MRKPRKIIKVKCINCGVTFDAKSQGNLRCDECRKEWARQQSKNYRDKCRSKAEKTIQRVKIRPRMSIREVIKAIEKYNRENHTHLTYGQFVMLMESGKI